MALTGGVHESSALHAPIVVRQLGALERLFYRHAERNPAHFSIAVEFNGILPETAVRRALSDVQCRNPLLAVCVGDTPALGLCFLRPDEDAPIPITVRRGTPGEWQSVVADELARPFDRSQAPLVRVTLLSDDSRTALIATFDHTVADGVSAVNVIRDLVSALNGRSLDALPVPPTVEAMVTQMPAPATVPTYPESLIDPRMRRATRPRPFDGERPLTAAVELSAEDTSRLVQRCREEHTTVHAAIIAAACAVRAVECEEGFVRVLSPVNIRDHIAVGPDCALYFVGAISGVSEPGQSGFWSDTCVITEQLAPLRSGGGVAAASAAIEYVCPTGADAAVAEAVFTTVMPFEMLISNLGIQDFEDLGPITPIALWGPFVQAQISGEYVVGAVTHNGRLRIVACGYQLPPDYLDHVHAYLVRESR